MACPPAAQGCLHTGLCLMGIEELKSKDRTAAGYAQSDSHMRLATDSIQ